MARTKYIVLDSKVLVVAVEGSIGDWAAYIGAVPGYNFDEEWQRVAENGTKLPKSIAEILFPLFKDLKWRE